MAESTPPTTTNAVIDLDAGSVFYLAFDLMLAEAPIRDGAVQIRESRLARSDPNDLARASRYAALRAALLKGYGSGFASDRDEEIERARAFALSAGQEVPVIPDDEVTTLTLHRDRPTPLS